MPKTSENGLCLTCGADRKTTRCPDCLSYRMPALESPGGDRAAAHESGVVRSLHCVHGQVMDICDKCNGKAETPLASAENHEQTQNALRAVLELIEMGILVRDTSNDANFMAFTAQGVKIVRVLAQAKAALEPSVGRGPENQPVAQVSELLDFIEQWHSTFATGGHMEPVLEAYYKLRDSGLLSAPPVSEDSDSLEYFERWYVKYGVPLGIGKDNAWIVFNAALSSPAVAERWKYLCADGQWKPCELLPWDKDGYITIKANGVKHLVPAKNVRPSPAVEDVGEVEKAKSLELLEEFYRTLSEPLTRPFWRETLHAKVGALLGKEPIEYGE